MARVKIVGKSIHTGSAKGIMKNASRIACEFESMLPPDEVPEKTEGLEGFYHLSSMKSGVGEAIMIYLLRDFDKAMLEERKQQIFAIADALNEKYGEDTVLVDIEDQYQNMKDAYLLYTIYLTLTNMLISIFSII